MTTQQALEAAQVRVDSFKPYVINTPFMDEENRLIEGMTALTNARKCATIAIETEIDTVNEIALPFYAQDVIINLKKTKEQIQYTL